MRCTCEMYSCVKLTLTVSDDQGLDLGHGVSQICGNSSVFGLILTDQFGSVRFKMVSVRSEKPICALPGLSEVSPTSPLKRFQCSSD